MQVLEIRDELVHRRVGQDEPRLRDAALDFMTEVDRRLHGLRRFDAGHLRERGNETGPVFPLSGEHGAAALGDAVIPPPPLTGLLHPSALDQRPFFEAIERGVKRRHREPHVAAGSRLDLPADLIAMVIGIVQEREDEEIGAPFLGGVEGGPVRLRRGRLRRDKSSSSFVIYRQTEYHVGRRLPSKGWALSRRSAEREGGRSNANTRVPGRDVFVIDPEDQA